MTKKPWRWLAISCSWMLLFPAPGWAEDVPPEKLTEAEKQRAFELEKAKMFADKEKDLITSQNELAKAKVAAATPAAAAGVTPLTGAVTGANEMSFAMYMVSLEGLERVAQALCNDLARQGVAKAFMTGKDAVEASAKDEAARRAREQLTVKLKVAKTEVEAMTARLDGTSQQPKISAASVAAIASGIDMASGLLKGVAGLAGLFKSERTIQGADNVLTSAEVSAALSMCKAGGANAAAPVVRYLDGDAQALLAKVAVIGNEVKVVSDLASDLEGAATKMLNAAAALEAEVVAATSAKNKAQLEALKARKAPANFDVFKSKVSALVTQAQAYVDAVYQVDTTSGLSPMIVSAQFRVLREALETDARLTLTLLKSGGYALTTKRLLLNDRVDFAGGLAVRASVSNRSGDLAYDRVFYRDSGWIRADFHTTGETIKRQNF
ncbi:hypothetical protein QRD43_02945 [Pelomonas sp. APW6]|uniref:Uncharacterized protein n=1 Tax=Roseateles subflavus TaxID=3053353 RepID=A0ABT7LEX1_9BURK|nr:hypothetical protein [Pelomonas sp. APW6]MDL5030852.1 hypothetical protein [Pelomonas sp. APW6]